MSSKGISMNTVIVAGAAGLIGSEIPVSGPARTPARRQIVDSDRSFGVEPGKLLQSFV
jgi:hypothetical protein